MPSNRLQLITSSRWIAAVLLGLAALWHWGQAAHILLKAELAQHLIENAWQRTLAGERAVRPWAWADTHPIGRLRWVNQHGAPLQDVYVLAGAQGNSLAFGPGQVEGIEQHATAARVIGGHRDTHFRFLQDLQIGSKLLWQNRHGDWQGYRVVDIRIAHNEREKLWIDADDNSLWLITCYPFNALRAGGPLRYVVRAEPEGILALDN